MTRSTLTAERVRQLFLYDGQTGTLTRRVRTSDSTHVGEIAGHLTATGYRNVCVDGLSYREHRIVWLFVHGEWPAGDVDHINGVRSDNRASNLRDVTRSMNMENQRRARSNNRTSGELGVSWDASRGKWYAQLFARGRWVYRKRFADKADAVSAYLDAKRQFHEGCTI